MAFFFFFNDTATTEIYTLSLHDALPISRATGRAGRRRSRPARLCVPRGGAPSGDRFRASRSEEHTSELQSLAYLVCRLLLEKKKKMNTPCSSTQVARTHAYRARTHASHT